MNAVEKLALPEIRPARLRDVSVDDLRQIWLRLNQWHDEAVREGEAVENVVNAASWVVDEMERRGVEYSADLPLSQAARRLGKGELERLSALAPEIVVVKDFVAAVGSAARGKADPGDLDVLVRADRDGDHFRIGAENVWLPVRNALGEGRSVHLIPNAQGAHGDNVPLYDLVLRRRPELAVQIVKADRTIAVGDVVELLAEHAPGHRGKRATVTAVEPAALEVIVEGEDQPHRWYVAAEVRLGSVAKSETEARTLHEFLTDVLGMPRDADAEALAEALGRAAEEAAEHPAGAWPESHLVLVRALGLTDDLSEAAALRRLRDVALELASQAVDIDGRGGVQKADDEGETRGEVAEQFWRENWWKLLPKSGKGRFVYQHHWRGLDENQARDASDDDLLGTDHSVHGDLRLEGVDGLWGWAVLIGRAEDNRAGDKLLDLGDGNLRLEPKLQQPEAWLEVGVGKPLIVEPGGVGAESQTWAKFFAIDSGTYELGAVKQHSVEVFLNGDKLRGRYALQAIPAEGGRVWNVSKPEDQAPHFSTADIGVELRDQKEKGRAGIFVGRPLKDPVWVPADASAETISEIEGRLQRVEKWVPISKADEDRMLVYGVVLTPRLTEAGELIGEPDTQGDVMRPSEIEAACHRFARSMVVGIRHASKAPARVVESYIAPHDLDLGGKPVQAGSWVVAVKIDDAEIWRQIKAGELNGFSVGGWARQRPL